jgi:hypothetical protein
MKESSSAPLRGDRAPAQAPSAHPACWETLLRLKEKDGG